MNTVSNIRSIHSKRKKNLWTKIFKRLKENTHLKPYIYETKEEYKKRLDIQKYK